MAVRVQYTYCHSYSDLHGYFDRGGGGGVGERVAVSVQYTYCHSYCDLHGYSDRGGKRREWQYMYSSHTAAVTVTYMDTLTVGGGGGGGESGSKCTVHVLPQLL